MSGYESNEESPSRLSEMLRFLYNPDTKLVLGRSGKSWALIGIFYLIFYACLAGFFVGMLAVFLNVVITPQEPKLTGMQSLLKMTPGISFFPLPDYKSTLVRFSVSKNLSYVTYTEDIEARLQPISEIAKKDSERFAKCDLDKDTKVPNDNPMKICRFQKELLGECNNSTDYGYAIGKPCIFIKLNKIFGWIPDVEDTSSPYVLCEGETVADKENLGNVNYYPPMNVSSEGGKVFAKISNVFFPYLKQESYASPVAAIQFTNPTRNVLTMVRCSLLGLKTDAELFVRLELLVED